ncbi:MAG: alpha/beta fold hydrolase [Novosphingobium sp.]|nr:alpha/beta fold hydrolase [Novosphingobium sp.]
MNGEESQLIDIGDTSLYVVQRGRGYPLIVLHGGPGLDHHMYGDYLDALTDRYRLVLVDQRANGRSGRPPEDTWTLEQNAKDVGRLASSMGLDKYAVLGHSYGALVTLQLAVDFPGQAAQYIVSSGVPGGRFLMSHVEHELANFEPEELRQQVADSWAREQHVQTHDLARFARRRARRCRRVHRLEGREHAVIERHIDPNNPACVMGAR